MVVYFNEFAKDARLLIVVSLIKSNRIHWQMNLLLTFNISRLTLNINHHNLRSIPYSNSWSPSTKAC